MNSRRGSAAFAKANASVDHMCKCTWLSANGMEILLVPATRGACRRARKQGGLECLGKHHLWGHDLYFGGVNRQPNSLPSVKLEPDHAPFKIRTGILLH